MPTSDLDRIAYSVADIYAEAERLLLERIARSLAKGLDSPAWAEEKLAQIRAHRAYAQSLITDLEAKVQTGAETALAQAYEQGGLSAVEELTSSKSPTPRPEPLGGLRGVERLNAELVTNLAATHPRILRAAMDEYRDVIAKTTQQVLLGTQTRRQAAQAALDDFAKRGITGFVDKAGKNWSLDTYAEMATRTATHHAAVQGHIDQLAEYGEDLVMVSDVPGECPTCRPWEGKVLSANGQTPGYPTLDEAKAAGLMHPGCRHRTYLWQGGVTKPMKRTADPERYEASQKQRYLERQVRASKRIEAAALDDAAAAKAKARTRAYQAKLRELCDQSGNPRLYYREQIGKAH